MFKVNILLHDESLAKKVEVVWTLIPILILLFLAWNSVAALYVTENYLPEYGVSLIGNQWYWSWEYFSANSDNLIDGSSYLVSEMDIVNGIYFTLDVDNRVCIPCRKCVEFIVSSSDVLHSFAIPSLGVKVDAVPGRIVSLLLNVDLPAILYGQCSEMCGTGHALMPIVVEVIPSICEN